eukprot:16444582-Heterocapsa_arctica.AAC.1
MAYFKLGPHDDGVLSCPISGLVEDGVLHRELVVIVQAEVLRRWRIRHLRRRLRRCATAFRGGRVQPPPRLRSRRPCPSCGFRRQSCRFSTPV